MPTAAATVESVNVVHAVIPDALGDLDTTAIDKRPVPGRRAVDTLVGVAGDRIIDTKNHGGRDKAVYAYAREDLDAWSRELGRALPGGTFGENLTTYGVDLTHAVIGDHWRVGSDGLVLEVASPRIPCKTFQGWMDEPHWVKRFYAYGAPGAYLRVLSEGTVGSGDRIEVVHRPGHGVTISDTFALRLTSAAVLERLLDEQPDLEVTLAAAIRRDLAARASTPG
ncbi:MAG TPA: MOSC domain-containing protein [Actinomycetes bacterium]|nr:MOSC domain-containing protein [Actinomycetes bacterium]